MMYSDGWHKIYDNYAMTENGKVLYLYSMEDHKTVFPFYADGTDAIGKYSVDGLRKAIKQGRAFVL